MSWLKQTLSSTIGRKWIMSFTGLFLVLFLIGHLVGNLQLFINDGGQSFNIYAKFMTTNKFVKILSYVTYLSILGHVIYSVMLTGYNRKARPVSYKVSGSNANSPWTSRNMGVLGTIVLIFLVVHLQGFWYKMHWGPIGKVVYDGESYNDLYTVVAVAFQEWWIVALYVLAMFGLGFHLSHGFSSAFQTLGFNHKKYTPIIKTAGLLFAIIVPALFAAMPLYFFFIK